MVSPQNIPDGQAVVTNVPTHVGRMEHVETYDERIPMHTAPVPSYVRWGPVIAGSLFTISIMTLSAALGALVTSYAGPGPAVASNIGWGRGIWIVVTAIIALGLGGYTCCALAGAHSRANALLHGCAVWALTLPLLSVLLAIGTWAVQVAAAGNAGGVNNAVMYDFGIGAGVGIGGAWALFLGILLGLGAAAIGGTMGFASRHEHISNGS